MTLEELTVLVRFGSHASSRPSSRIDGFDEQCATSLFG